MKSSVSLQKISLCPSLDTARENGCRGILMPKGAEKFGATILLTRMLIFQMMSEYAGSAVKERCKTVQGEAI